MRWHKLGEVENEYTSEKLVFAAIFVPRIFTVGLNLTKLWEKISLHSFFETQCINSTGLGLGRNGKYRKISNSGSECNRSSEGIIAKKNWVDGGKSHNANICLIKVIILPNFPENTHEFSRMQVASLLLKPSICSGQLWLLLADCTWSSGIGTEWMLLQLGLTKYTGTECTPSNWNSRRLITYVYPNM